MAKNKRKEAAKQAAAAAAPGLSPKVPAWLLFPAVLVWLLVVLINYKTRNNFFLVNPFDTPLWLAYFHKGFELFKYVPQLALAGMFSLFAFFTGGLLLKAVAGADNQDIGGLDWLLFSLGLGFGALSLLTLGLGIAAVERFRREWPGVAVNLFDMTATQQAEALIQGRLDVGFIGFAQEADAAGLAKRRIGVCSFVAALPKNHRAARRRQVALATLAQDFFFEISEENYHGVWMWRGS